MGFGYTSTLLNSLSEGKTTRVVEVLFGLIGGIARFMPGSRFFLAFFLSK
jgi:hypothetical protein